MDAAYDTIACKNGGLPSESLPSLAYLIPKLGLTRERETPRYRHVRRSPGCLRHTPARPPIANRISTRPHRPIRNCFPGTAENTSAAPPDLSRRSGLPRRRKPRISDVIIRETRPRGQDSGWPGRSGWPRPSRGRNQGDLPSPAPISGRPLTPRSRRRPRTPSAAQCHSRGTGPRSMAR